MPNALWICEQVSKKKWIEDSSFDMKHTLIPYWLVIFLCCGFSSPLSYAEAVPRNLIDQTQHFPVKKGKKKRKHKKRKRLFAKPNKTKGNIVSSLYITFAILILLPVLIISGLILIGVGYPILLYLYLGLSFIIIGNLGALLAGSLAGANKLYSSQALSFGLWALFGINLGGAIGLFLLNILLFSSLFLWILAASLFVLAIVALIWALIIRKKNRRFRNVKSSEEKIK